MISTLVGIFGVEFLSHTILGFSRWSFDEGAVQERIAQNDNEHIKATNFAALFRAKFALNFDIPSFFYDKRYSRNVTHNPQEYALYQRQIAVLTNFVNNSTRCDMRGIVAIMAEKDRLRREAEEQQKRAEEQARIATEQRRRAEEQARIAEAERLRALAEQKRAQEAQRQAQEAQRQAEEARRQSIVSSVVETQEIAVGGQWRNEDSRKTRWHKFGYRDTVFWSMRQKYHHQQRTKNTRGSGAVEYTPWVTVREEDRTISNGSHHE